MCDLLQGLLKTAGGDNLTASPTPTYNAEQTRRFFVFALMWSVGALLELDDRAKLEQFLRSHKFKLDLPDCKEDETIFEYMVDKVLQYVVI